jgi:hypothetical protein
VQSAGSGPHPGAMAELEAVLGPPVAGVSGGLYDNSLFEDGRGHVIVYLPVEKAPTTGRVHPVTLPAVDLAVATHAGEHDDIDVTYGELGAWVVANALSVAGPVPEHYLIGTRDVRPDRVAHRDRPAGLPDGPLIRTFSQRSRTAADTRSKPSR